MSLPEIGAIATGLIFVAAGLYFGHAIFKASTEEIKGLPGDYVSRERRVGLVSSVGEVEQSTLHVLPHLPSTGDYVSRDRSGGVVSYYTSWSRELISRSLISIAPPGPRQIVR